jgi:hypothetical protein
MLVRVAPVSAFATTVSAPCCPATRTSVVYPSVRSSGVGRVCSDGRHSGTLSSNSADSSRTRSSSTVPPACRIAWAAIAGAGLTPVASKKPLNPAVTFTSNTYQPSTPSITSTPA